MLSEELAVLAAITDVAVKLAGAGLTEQADWAGKQAALLTSALAKRYWEEPKLSELAVDELADGGRGLGEREAKVVKVEEGDEVFRGFMGTVRVSADAFAPELSVVTVDGIPLSATGEGAGVEAADEAVRQVEDAELAPVKPLRLAALSSTKASQPLPKTTWKRSRG